MLWGKMECKRKTHRRKEWSKSNPLCNVEIIWNTKNSGNTFKIKILLFWRYFQKMGLFLSRWAYFLRSKDNVGFTKTYFLIEAASLSVNIHEYMSFI